MSFQQTVLTDNITVPGGGTLLMVAARAGATIQIVNLTISYNNVISADSDVDIDDAAGATLATYRFIVGARVKLVIGTGNGVVISNPTVGSRLDLVNGHVGNSARVLVGWVYLTV